MIQNAQNEDKADFESAWKEPAAEAPDEFEAEAQKRTLAERLEAGDGMKVADASGAIPSDDAMAKMSHGDLLLLRKSRRDDDKEAQNTIAKFEHRAYARESVKDNPATALTLPLMIPIYSAGKALGVLKGRSDASLEQMKHGFIGLGEGVADAVR